MSNWLKQYGESNSNQMHSLGRKVIRIEIQITAKSNQLTSGPCPTYPASFMKPIQKFCSNLVNRQKQTDKQTDKRTKNIKNITFFGRGSETNDAGGSLNVSESNLKTLALIIMTRIMGLNTTNYGKCSTHCMCNQ